MAAVRQQSKRGGQWAAGRAPASARWAFVIALLASAAPLASAASPPPQDPPRPMQPGRPAPGLAETQHLTAVLEQSIRQAIEQGGPSLAAIARQRLPNPDLPQHPAQKRSFEAGPNDPSFVAHEWACGVVVDPAGLVLVPYHVLGNPAQNRYWVWLAGRREALLALEVKAAVPWLDLALLHVDAQQLQPMPLGDSDQCFAGQFVVSVGGPVALARGQAAASAWGTLASVSEQAPLVSQRPETGGRETLYHYGSLLQTDFDASRLGSGAAVLDLSGRLIGLATSLASREALGRPEGLVIPVNQATTRVIQEMRSGKRSDFGFLGVEPVELSPLARQRGLTGVEVRDVVQGTPAEKAGLRRGDIITGVGPRLIDDPLDITRWLSRYAAGQEVKLAVLRDGRALTLTPQLAKRPFASLRPEIAAVAPRSWRGMQVDYGSVAISARRYSAQLRGRTPLAVVAVAAESPAWEAGLRPGDLLLSYNGQSDLLPETFYRVAENHPGGMKLEVLSQGQIEEITLQP